MLEHATTPELQRRCLKICEIGAQMRIVRPEPDRAGIGLGLLAPLALTPGGDGEPQMRVQQIGLWHGWLPFVPDRQLFLGALGVDPRLRDQVVECLRSMVPSTKSSVPRRIRSRAL